MNNLLNKSKPVWIKDREKEINLCVAFRTVVPYNKGVSTFLSLAASTVYRVFINDCFIAYGPARACKDYFRVDKIDITKNLTLQNNIVTIEVIGYNINSYYFQNQPSFLQSEISVDSDIIKATGNGDFECKVFSEHIQKTQRYSFQRDCVEAYIMDENYNKFRTDLDYSFKKEELITTEPKTLLERNVPYPEYERTPICSFISEGNVDTTFKPENYIRDYSLTDISEKILGYKQEELTVHITDEGQNLKFTQTIGEKALQENYKFNENTYKIFEFPYNTSGFINLNVTALSDVTMYVMFDEILKDGDVDFLRLGCANIIKFDLKKGTYKLEVFEAYTLKYLKIIIIKGNCDINDIHIVEYKHKLIETNVKMPNEKLSLIYKAAVETYRQNAVDLFTDCPSRERAGWLCDSFFLGRVEKELTGKSIIEKNFLENFLLPKEFEYLPKGMFPMCYPADHYNGNFIPNWAMWLVLELGEYLDRTSDFKMVESFKDKIYGLIDYFKDFENEDSLLENLQRWIFVEWSKANELVKDVNYPSNMVYSKMLKVAGELYSDESLIKKAEVIKQKIKELSYNGEFFTDNAVRKNAVLTNTNEATEVCQYYAFYFDIANPNEYPELFNKLLNDFGPDRQNDNKYPQIYPANAFIGNYLRLDILMRYGYEQKVLENIEGYFYYMAQRTGTLWEHSGDYASCNHGFASHVVVWLNKIFK
jgi:alpha-L-rhamnosidase